MSDKRWIMEAAFTADLTEEQQADLRTAVWAQLEMFEEVEVELLEDEYWLGHALGNSGPAGGASWLLSAVSLLEDVAGLVDAAFRLTLGRSPCWITVSEGTGLIYSDLGNMSLGTFREYYSADARRQGSRA